MWFDHWSKKIILTQDVSENRLVSNLHGELAGILGMATKEKANLQLTDSAISAQRAVINGFKARNGIPEDAMQVKLVAGGHNQRYLRLITSEVPQLAA